MKQLWKSFRQAFWRCPDVFDFIIWAFCIGAFLLDCTSLSGASYAALKWSLWVRAWMFIFDYGSRRWPQHYERIIYAPFALFGLYLLVNIGISTDWKSVAQMRPDWQGIWFSLKFGAGAVCYFGPLMWLLDRVFKPFARRTGHYVFSAVGFIALCGMWWSGLVFGLLAISNKNWW